MKTIPAIHTTQMTPLVELLRDAGAPVAALLERNSISPEILESRSGFVPAERIFNFIELAGRSQGIDDIGWQAGYETNLLRSGGWAHEACRAETLRDALGVLVRRYQKVVPLVEMGLTEGSATAWLWRRRLVDLRQNPGHPAVEQFTLARFMKLIHVATGEQWAPDHLKVESQLANTTVPRHPAWAETRTQHGAPVLAIEIPLDLLGRPMPPTSPTASAFSVAADPPAPTLEQFLQDAFSDDVDQRALTSELAAEVVRISDRTLRRQLRDEGTSWRAVRDRLLHQKCRHLLESSDLLIGEIAMSLGYSDSAHLTRAFERWQGESPTRYRLRRTTPIGVAPSQPT